MERIAKLRQFSDLLQKGLFSNELSRMEMGSLHFNDVLILVAVFNKMTRAYTEAGRMVARAEEAIHYEETGSYVYAEIADQ